MIRSDARLENGLSQFAYDLTISYLGFAAIIVRGYAAAPFCIAQACP